MWNDCVDGANITLLASWTRTRRTSGQFLKPWQRSIILASPVNGHQLPKYEAGFHKEVDDVDPAAQDT